MAKRGEKLEKSFDRLSERQMEIYATELQEHYHEERRLRRELETRNHELEQRVNELLSLNRLFQKFISQGFGNSNTEPALSPGAENPKADLEDVPQGPAKISGKENSVDLSGPMEDDLNNFGGTAPEARS